MSLPYQKRQNFSATCEKGTTFVKVIWWHRILADFRGYFCPVFYENICESKHINSQNFSRMWKTRAHVSGSLNKFAAVLKKIFRNNEKGIFVSTLVLTNCQYNTCYFQPSCLVIFKFTFTLKFCHFQIFLVASLSIKSPSILDDLNCVLPGELAVVTDFSRLENGAPGGRERVSAVTSSLRDSQRPTDRSHL